MDSNVAREAGRDEGVNGRAGMVEWGAEALYFTIIRVNQKIDPNPVQSSGCPAPLQRCSLHCRAGRLGRVPYQERAGYGSC